MIVLLCLFLFSCEEQFGLKSNKISQDVIDNSLELFPGSILEKCSDKIEGIDVWKVKIENNAGAIVSFYWQKNYTILFRIEGEKGPFSYELKPHLGIIVVSTARFLAFESYSSEELIYWKLIRDNSLDQKWVYQFFLKEKEVPITVNATSGDII